MDLAAIVTLILAQCTHLEGLGAHHGFIQTSNPWFPVMINIALSTPEGANLPPGFHSLTSLAMTVSDPMLEHIFLPTQALLRAF